MCSAPTSTCAHSQLQRPSPRRALRGWYARRTICHRDVCRRHSRRDHRHHRHLCRLRCRLRCAAISAKEVEGKCFFHHRHRCCLCRRSCSPPMTSAQSSRPQQLQMSRFVSPVSVQRGARLEARHHRAMLVDLVHHFRLGAATVPAADVTVVRGIPSATGRRAALGARGEMDSRRSVHVCRRWVKQGRRRVGRWKALLGDDANVGQVLANQVREAAEAALRVGRAR